jgi:hypothetical protein
MNKKQRGPLSGQFIIEIDITNTNFRHNGFFLRMKGRRIMDQISFQKTVNKATAVATCTATSKIRAPSSIPKSF